MVTPAAVDATPLIKEIAKHNRDAFNQFYDCFSPLVYSLALRILGSQSDADDVLQEVFMQIWRQAETFDPNRGAPEAWLNNIARTRAIDKLRSRRRMEKSFILTDDPTQAESGDNVESSAAEAESRVMMNSVLARLPEMQRRVLELAYFAGMSQTEIASKLKEPLGTVKTRMRNGIQRLRDMLGTPAAQ